MKKELELKLKEIGYNGETDLETILEALPSCIESYYLRMSKNSLWYETLCNCDSSEYCPVNTQFTINKQNNESLAGTAARLLILLFEKKLIKFEE